MDYPAWFVPYLTAPMLIPLVAIPHVIMAQFAVGGGFLLADLVRRAYCGRSQGLLDYLKRLTRVFTLLTIGFLRVILRSRRALVGSPLERFVHDKL